MYIKLIIFCLFLRALFVSVEASEPKQICRQIYSHLLISHPKMAVEEAKEALTRFPESLEIHEMLIRSLAACGEVEEMMGEWEKFSEKNSEAAVHQDLLEEMCFGILQKGQKVRGTSPQLISLIGAGLTQDIRAVPFLLAGMRHTNAVIRSIAVELGSLYGDHVFKEEVARLFKEETVSDVRLDVIKAVGILKIESLYRDLLALISNPKTKSDEKQVAIQAIVEMKECLDQKEIALLIKSPRSGLRQLGCEVIAHCELKEQCPIVLPLLKDSNPEVQAAALRVLGILKAELNDTIRELATNAHDPLVGVTAAWVCLLRGKEEEAGLMKKWLFHADEYTRRLASGALASSGSYGIPLAREGLEQSEDPYVKANLSLGLIGQREECEKACLVLDTFLRTNQERWMWDEKTNFKFLQKSTHAHSPTIANYPEVIDQTVRLEILNLLAILDYPKAQELVKEFLKKGHYGVTGLAAETILGEGDASAIEIVRELLADKDKEVRFEAALVLATWGKDPSAIPVLIDMYPHADRELKIKILEALGGIGDKKTLPFLIERLKEPSLVLRMISACILLRTLNH